MDLTLAAFVPSFLPRLRIIVLEEKREMKTFSTFSSGHGMTIASKSGRSQKKLGAPVEYFILSWHSLWEPLTWLTRYLLVVEGKVPYPPST